MTLMSIPKPDVTVTVTTRTTTPTVTTPALPPVILGPCYFVLDPQLSTGLAVNPDAKVLLPAMIQGFKAPENFTLGGAGVVLSLNIGGIPVPVTFAAGSYTPAQVVTAINQALATKGVGAVAEIVGTGATARFRLRTTTKGSGTYIIWEATGVLAQVDTFCGTMNPGVADGLMVPRTWRADGISFYDQTRQIFGFQEYPDPKGLIDSLDIDTDTVRLFASLSAGLSEWDKTTAVARCGKATLEYFDDGDADGYTNLVIFTSGAPPWASVPSDESGVTGAEVTDTDMIEFTGIVPVGQASFIAGSFGDIGVASDLSIEVNGFQLQTITILATDGAPAVAAKINARFPDIASAVDIAPPVVIATNGPVKAPVAGDGTLALVSPHLTSAAETFDLPDVGNYIVVTGSGAGNDGNYIIAGVVGVPPQPTIDFTVPPVAPEVGVFTWIEVTSLYNIAGPNILNDPGSPFLPTHVGRTIVVSGTAGGVNDGTYTVASYVSPTQITVSPNWPGAPEGPGFTWAIRASRLQLDASAFAPNLATAGNGMEAWGRESYIKVLGSDALLEHLFGNDAPGSVKSNVSRGKWYPLAPGAQLYVEGVFIGNVIEIFTDRVKLDREVPEMAATGKNFYFVHTALSEKMIGDGGPAGTPSPDLFVADSSSSYATEGTVRINPELLRVSVNGQPQVQPLMDSTVYCDEVMAYVGLRLDVTPTADNPDLLQYSSATELVADLSPIDTTNPLALGLYYALVNSPGLTVYGLGVDEVSPSYPEGTLESYTECAEFLESRDIYSIVPLTHNEDVAKMLQIHVDSMSDPEMKGERILWWNPSMPVRERSTIIASGAKGNCSNPGVAVQFVFNTGLPDLPARFTAAGISMPATPPAPESEMIFVQLASQGSKMYAVIKVSGPLMTLSEYSSAGAGGAIAWTYTGALDGVFEANFWSGALVDEPFTVGKLGASLYNSLGKYNKDKAAESIHNLGQEFADRRVRMIVPDEVIATIGGLEQAIAGYYACCCLAGMKSAQSPSQGFTNMRIAGIDRVQRTQGYFKESQLNIMAGGGAWILIPGPGGGGVVSRMSLTTDTSTVEFRQDSWTSAIDYGAKYMRIILRRVIGPTNITQAAIDLVASLVDSSLRFLIDNRIWTDGTLQKIEQSASEPDALDVGVTARIPYNLNYINVTITV